MSSIQLMRIGVVLLLGVVHLVGQVRRGEGSPIAPEIMLFDNIGAGIGVPLVVQQGAYYDTCQCPPFTGGAGSGIVVNAFYELPHEKSSLLQLGIGAEADYRTLISRYREVESLEFVTEDGGQRFPAVPVEFQQETTFRLFGGWLHPYVRVVLPRSEALWLSLGARLGAILGGTVNHTKSVVQSSVRLPNGEIVALDQRTQTIREGEILDLRRLQADITLQVGSTFQLGNEWLLRPTLRYQLPLQQLSGSGDLRVATWVFMLSVARERQQ